MTDNQNMMPLLLVDNSSIIDIIDVGDYQVKNMMLDDVIALLQQLGPDDIRICFTNSYISEIIFPWLGIKKNKKFKYQEPVALEPGQDALVFKLHVTKSDTQPTVLLEPGVEAKKIQNVYIYCKHVIRNI